MKEKGSDTRLDAASGSDSGQLGVVLRPAHRRADQASLTETEAPYVESHHWPGDRSGSRHPATVSQSVEEFDELVTADDIDHRIDLCDVRDGVDSS